MLRLEMPNPWLKLAAKPYVLPEDADLVAKFNATTDATYRIDLNVFPDPFCRITGCANMASQPQSRLTANGLSSSAARCRNAATLNCS